MTIKSIQVGQVGLVGQLPQWLYISTTDSVATVTTVGYLNGAAHEYVASLSNTMMAEVTIISSTNALPQVLLFQVSGVNGVWSLVQPYVQTNPVNGQIISITETSATPGVVRALTGKMIETATTVSSGNLVGLRGEVDFIGCSGGYFYGLQGKLIPTGVISNSGGGFEAGILGQFDVSAATLGSTSYMAPVWSDFGATATSGTYSSCFMFSGTNSTAAVLGGMMNLYGGATALMVLNDNNALVGSTYFKAAGTTSGSWGNASYPTVSKVLELSINGTPYYLPVITQNT